MGCHCGGGCRNFAVVNGKYVCRINKALKISEDKKQDGTTYCIWGVEA